MLELTMFRLADGADEAGFLEADARYQQGVVYQQAGIVRRTTAKGADGWLVVTQWWSAEHADACPPLSHPAIDPSSVAVARYDELGG